MLDFLSCELSKLEGIINRTLFDELAQLRLHLKPEPSETIAVSKRSSSTIAHKITKRTLPLPCGVRKRIVLHHHEEPSTSSRAKIVDWVVLKPKTKNADRPDMKLPVVLEQDLGLMSESEINHQIDQIPMGQRDDDDCSTQMTTQANALTYIRRYLKVTEHLLHKLQELKPK